MNEEQKKARIQQIIKSLGELTPPEAALALKWEKEGRNELSLYEALYARRWQFNDSFDYWSNKIETTDKTIIILTDISTLDPVEIDLRKINYIDTDSRTWRGIYFKKVEGEPVEYIEVRETMHEIVNLLIAKILEAS